MPRDYNGLTGAECLELFLRTIRERLEQDTRLLAHKAYHNVVLEVNLALESYPNDKMREEFHVKVGATDGPVPKGAKAQKEQVTSRKEYPAPDVAREELAVPAPKEIQQDDAQLATRADSRASF